MKTLGCCKKQSKEAIHLHTSWYKIAFQLNISMKSFISKSIVYFLAPAVTIILGLMKIPNFTEKWVPKGTFLAGFLDYFTIAGTVLIYYFSIWAPHRKYEKAKKSKWEALEKLAKVLSEDYADYNLSINIMLVKRSIFYRIEPKQGMPEKTKISVYGKVFTKARELTGYGLPIHLRLTLNQGVCGKALREGSETSKFNVKGVVLIPEFLTPQIETDNNFTTKQRFLTKDVVFVASCPLIIKKKEEDGFKKKQLGVLNVESKELASAQFFVDPELRNKFYEKIANLGNIFNILHV
jgi:hypothetical protein